MEEVAAGATETLLPINQIAPLHIPVNITLHCYGGNSQKI
jgi:hypothetical protein